MTGCRRVERGHRPAGRRSRLAIERAQGAAAAWLAEALAERDAVREHSWADGLAPVFESRAFIHAAAALIAQALVRAHAAVPDPHRRVGAEEHDDG